MKEETNEELIYGKLNGLKNLYVKGGKFEEWMYGGKGLWKEDGIDQLVHLKINVQTAGWIEGTLVVNVQWSLDA